MRCVTTRTGRQHTVMTADRWVWVGVLAASATLYTLYLAPEPDKAILLMHAHAVVHDNGAPANLFNNAVRTVDAIRFAFSGSGAPRYFWAADRVLAFLHAIDSL